MKQNINIEASNVVSNNDVRIDLPNLSQEEAKERTLGLHFLDLERAIEWLIDLSVSLMSAQNIFCKLTLTITSKLYKDN